MIEYLTSFVLCTLLALLLYLVRRYLTLLKMVEGIIENLTPDALQSDTKREKLIECKSLGKSIINMYSMGACAALGISNQDALREDLESDSFLNSALQRFTCELYYRLG